jgi:hypothetical protein
VNTDPAPVLPCSLDAERVLLGVVLLDDTALPRVGRIITASDFFKSANREVFKAMQKLAADGLPVELIGLCETLVGNADVIAAGGAAFLAELSDGIPRVMHVARYAEIVREKSYLRRAVHAALEIQSAALKPGAEISEINKRAREMVALLASCVRHRSGWSDIPDILTMPRIEITWAVDGLIPAGAVTLIAGSFGSYKTWLAQKMALAVSSGSVFLGRTCRAMDVLYLDAENPQAVVSERLKLLGAEPRENFRVWGGWLPEPPPILGDGRLRAIAQDHKPLIIFDSFIRFHKGDENSATDIAVAMSCLRELANLGATPVVLHHTPKTDSSLYRGSSDIPGGGDVAFSVRRQSETDLLTLKCFKTRFTKEFSLTLRADLEELGDFIVTEAPAVAQETGDLERLREVIKDEPGLAQEEIICKSGLPTAKARALLKQYVGNEWRAEKGAHNASRYFPISEVGEAVEIEI